MPVSVYNAKILRKAKRLAEEAYALVAEATNRELFETAKAPGDHEVTACSNARDVLSDGVKLIGQVPGIEVMG